MSALHPQLVAAQDAGAAIPVRFVLSGGRLDEAAQRWADVHGFEGKPGQLLVVPNAEGGVDQVIVGSGEGFDPMSARGLSARLPGGLYRLEVAADQAEQAALAVTEGIADPDLRAALAGLGARILTRPKHKGD